MEPRSVPDSPLPDLSVPPASDDEQVNITVLVVRSVSPVLPNAMLNGPPGCTDQVMAAAAGPAPRLTVAATAAAARKAPAPRNFVTIRIGPSLPGLPGAPQGPPRRQLPGPAVQALPSPWAA